MKSLKLTVALFAVVAITLLSCCVTGIDGQVVGMGSCRSTLEASKGAYCQMEAQGLSVNAKEFTVEAPKIEPAGKRMIDGVEWTFTGHSMVPPGTRIRARFVNVPCNDPRANACIDIVTLQMEVKRGRGDKLQSDVEHELWHLQATHPNSAAKPVLAR